MPCVSAPVCKVPTEGQIGPGRLAGWSRDGSAARRASRVRLSQQAVQQRQVVLLALR